MSSGNEILYIKGEKNTEVKEPNVTLGDILTMECSNSSIMNRIKPLRILKIPKKEQHRYVVSVLKIIECIRNIEEELRHSIDCHSKTLISRYIELLLDYCARFNERQFITRCEANKAILH